MDQDFLLKARAFAEKAKAQGATNKEINEFVTARYSEYLAQKQLEQTQKQQEKGMVVDVGNRRVLIDPYTGNVIQDLGENPDLYGKTGTGGDSDIASEDAYFGGADASFPGGTNPNAAGGDVYSDEDAFVNSLFANQQQEQPKDPIQESLDKIEQADKKRKGLIYTDPVTGKEVENVDLSKLSPETQNHINEQYKKQKEEKPSALSIGGVTPNLLNPGTQTVDGSGMNINSLYNQPKKEEKKSESKGIISYLKGLFGKKS